MKKRANILFIFFTILFFTITGCSKYKGDTGELNFWIDYNVGSQITVVVFVSTSADGKTGYLGGYYTSGPPACGGGEAAFILPSGSYHYQATAPGFLKVGTVTVRSNKCQMIKL